MNCDGENDAYTSTPDAHIEEVFIKCENVEKKVQKTPAKPRVRPYEDPQQRRQKFCLKWGQDFPWLRPTERDSSVGYCTVCRRDLVCKRTHLERHQKTLKHMRLQGFENMNSFNEPEADLIEAHTNGYLENDIDHDFEDEMMLDDDHIEYTTIKVEPAKFATFKEAEPVTLKKSPLKRTKIEKRSSQVSTFDNIIDPNTSKLSHSVKREREHVREMGDYYYMPRPPQKDSFDLFFESAAASVKSLPPKLAAELKSRVSQLLSEFELRAICEKEAQEKAAAAAGTQSITAIASPVTVAVDQSICSTSHGEPSRVGNQQLQDQHPIAHYVYSYQSK
ncbi:protein suppressor of variegation 3-7 [Musca domestica]|uniref:Protein suppressor of variegation 3-7 n=1 Tax=Musca domestica TaxID=7370 RepID=A0A9J7HY74_MUSDO|nr:protein suppressor of variegation 3-7 [Musca domestica]